MCFVNITLDLRLFKTTAYACIVTGQSLLACWHRAVYLGAPYESVLSMLRTLSIQEWAAMGNSPNAAYKDDDGYCCRYSYDPPFRFVPYALHIWIIA